MGARNRSSFPAAAAPAAASAPSTSCSLVDGATSRARTGAALVGPCWSWGLSHVDFHITISPLSGPYRQPDSNLTV
eukprot:5618506-Prymnesium_polylepis.2